MTRDEAYQLALGYACGREDASGEAMRGGVSRFTQAFASARAAYNCRTSSYMPSVQAAWLTWQQTGGRTIDPSEVLEAHTNERP